MRTNAFLIRLAMCMALVQAAAGAAWGQLPKESTMPSAEKSTMATLPDPKPHWVYVLDPVFPHIVAGKVYIIDGDTRDFVGMLNTGYTSNMSIAPDRKALYVAETFWSRGTRGDRVDVVTFYNPNTLEPDGEVRLPKGRYLIVPKKPDADLTPDGRYLLSYNMAPAMSVSVVDVKRKAYITDIETPGCALNFPVANNRFVMICADGSMANISFDGSGKSTLDRGKPFFDVVKDPVFEHAAWSKPASKGYFVSWEGLVYPVDFAGGTVKIGSPWSVTEAADKAWRPGGWQLAAYHPATKRLFVLMHQGGAWTHKQAGEEIWVFDADSHKRTARVKLEHHSISVAITQDAQPLLFALSETASMSVFDGTKYDHQGDVSPIGDSPYLLYVAGE